MSRLKKRVIAIAAVVFLVIAMAFIKVYSGSIKEYNRAEKALQKGDTEAAIVHYQRSIQWYTPLNRYVARSAERLWEIGDEAEKNGDNDLAMMAYQELRSSFYSVRSFYTPYREWIDRVDNRISTLLAKRKPYSEEDRTRPFEQRREDALRILKKNLAPNVFWSVILEVGFLGWIGCIIGFIFRVFTGEKGFDGRRALLWGGVIIIFYALWIVGMIRA
ncbi:MAG: hypothetical protein ABID54_06165 [Pseudomonadota bacterium]